MGSGCPFLLFGGGIVQFQLCIPENQVHGSPWQTYEGRKRADHSLKLRLEV